MFRIACAVLVASLLSGCITKPLYQSYAGEPLPASQQAVITGEKIGDHTVLQGLNQVVFITCVDGKSTQNFLALNAMYPTSTAVQPGIHYVGVMYTHMNSYARGVLWLNAQAGKAYKVAMQATGYAVRFWLVDESTNEIVGGIGMSGPAVPREMLCQ